MGRGYIRVMFLFKTSFCPTAFKPICGKCSQGQKRMRSNKKKHFLCRNARTCFCSHSRINTKLQCWNEQDHLSLVFLSYIFWLSDHSCPIRAWIICPDPIVSSDIISQAWLSFRLHNQFSHISSSTFMALKSYFFLALYFCLVGPLMKSLFSFL